MVTFTRRTVFILAIPMLCFGKYVVADEYHNNNLLIGDRASGMGGAYTAISDDATGLYYNPAAIVYAGDKNISASVNTYFSQKKKYENVIGNQAFERTSSSMLANYFGIVKSLGNLKLGFSYAIPNSVNENQNQTFSNVSAIQSRYTINVSNIDNTYNYGPSLAAEIKENLAVGITLYAHQRDESLILNQYTERADGTNRWTSKYFNLHESGVRPVLGLSWSPADKLTLGASLSRTFVFNSAASQQSTCWDAAASNGTATSTTGCSTSTAAPSIKVPTIATNNITRSYPTRLAIGAAYFVDKNMIVSGDLIYHSGVTDPFYGVKLATLDAAIGTEYYVSKKLAIRAGLFTNMANTPAIDPNAPSAEEHINLYGISMSASSFSGSSSVTLGGSVTYGQGQSQILTNSGIQNASTLGWIIFLSSSY